MIEIVAFPDEGLGNSSYLIDGGDGSAIVVDPVRDLEPYRRGARERGLKLAGAIETHLHADFVSGAGALAADGITVAVPAAAAPAFPHRPLADGDELPLGDAIVRAIETPGHTPEHLSYLILRDARPVGLLSGGALLPGTVARTDLIAPEETEPLARRLHRAVHERIAPLPDDVIVYPTHGGGSFCSVAATGERTTTIGRERAANPVFTQSEDDFVAGLLAGLGSYPPYFLRLREVNRRGASSDGPLSLDRLAPDDAEAAMRGGAELIDVRSARAWADAHIPGSLSIELRPAFASWLGWLVDRDRPLLFVIDDAQSRGELIRACRSIGYDNLIGEIDGGIDAWRDAGRALSRVEVVTDPVVDGPLLDVRQDSEFTAGHVPGALHVELGALADAPTLPPSLTVMCGHGERATTAASVLERNGHRGVRVLAAGPGDWHRTTGMPLERGA
ncbi:MAG TPA: rhodanese-like domain-containing protein [Actinomycetota bacterium]|nr:rhodanese-like domain-containing protein [Actinomycetota bacterium]